MTILAILAVATVLSVVLTLGLLVRRARKAAGATRWKVSPGLENCYAGTLRDRIDRFQVEPVATTRWHESGEAVE